MKIKKIFKNNFKQMKYLKKQEELNTVKFSDLENWDISKKDEDNFTGTKDFDLKLAKKTLELLNEFGFNVLSVDEKDFLRRMDLILEPEKNLKEYRVSLSVRIPFDDYLENNEIEDFDSLSESEQEEIENEYKVDGFIDPDEMFGTTYNLTFSVFFPMSIKSHQYNLSALSDASKYLKLLNDSFPEIIKKGLIEDYVLSDYTEGFKKFLNNKGLNITNNNIEDVPTINKRIRKDSKFLYELKKACKYYNINYTNLMNEWIKIL